MRRKERKATDKDVASILNSLSDRDLKLLAIDDIDDYVSYNHNLIKRFIEKDENNVPVAFFDIQDNNGVGNVVIGTRSGSEYRHKGYATKAAKKGIKWMEKNGKYLEMPYDSLEWNAYKLNKKSINLAKNLGLNRASITRIIGIGEAPITQKASKIDIQGVDLSDYSYQ